jgi:hypothetical protein
VVTFLHKNVFERPIRLDWAGQYTNKSMKPMLQGRMLWLWAPRHSEPPMLVVNIHQAGSADADLQQRVWLAIQAMRARYPSAQGNANAHGQRVGYSPGNAHHMEKIDDQFQACVSALKGALVSPRTPSRIDERMCKEARPDHLLGFWSGVHE